MNQAELSRLVSTLRVSVKPRHRQMATPEGPAGRLKALRATVTALLKYERIELYYNRADEARGYAERVIFCCFFSSGLKLNFQLIIFHLYLNAQGR